MSPDDKTPAGMPDAWRLIGNLETAIADLKETVESHQLRVENALLKVMNMELRCPLHEQTLEELKARLDRVEQRGHTVRTPSGFQAAVKEQVSELKEGLEENTEKVALQAVRKEMHATVAAQVTDALVTQLRKEREAEAAALAEMEKTRHDQEKVAQDKRDRSFSRFQWAVGTVITLLSSGSLIGWCTLTTKVDADQQTTMRAIQKRPEPVVIKVPQPIIVMPDAGK